MIWNLCTKQKGGGGRNLIRKDSKSKCINKTSKKVVKRSQRAWPTKIKSNIDPQRKLHSRGQKVIK